MNTYLVSGRPTVPIADAAVAFRAAHGALAAWSAQDFEVYLDLERAGAQPGEGGAP